MVMDAINNQADTLVTVFLEPELAVCVPISI